MVIAFFGGIYKNAKHILDFFILIISSVITWPAQEITCSQQQSNQSWPKLFCFSKSALLPTQNILFDKNFFGYSLTSRPGW
jgi:hypothetical protein